MYNELLLLRAQWHNEIRVSHSDIHQMLFIVDFLNISDAFTEFRIFLIGVSAIDVSGHCSYFITKYTLYCCRVVSLHARHPVCHQHVTIRCSW